MAETIYDFEFEDVKGNKILLSDYKNKLIVIVNTASECGFSKQFAEFEQISNKYKDRGLVVIAVPSNNFGQQEPGDDVSIASYCTINSITFNVTKKYDVVGSNSHPLFNWTRVNYGWLSGPKWNFYKFVISKKGEPIEWFSSLTSPISERFIKLIESNL